MLDALNDREHELATARDALARSEEQFELAMRGANDGLWDYDIVENSVFFSPRWKSMIGYAEEEVGHSIEEWSKRVHPDDSPAAISAFEAHLRGETDLFEASFRFRHRHGHWLHVLSRGIAVKGADGKPTRMVGTHTDITERKAAEEQIRTLAFYDPLTALPNRRLLLERLRMALSYNTRARHYGALLFIDLDNFKFLNDTMGHETGDQLLVEVAQRLQLSVRKGDMVARLGGDEFIVMLEAVDESLEQAA
jgi:PAS domain S-box-containing protein